MNGQQYIDFKGTPEQLNAFIGALYDDFRDTGKIVEIIVKDMEKERLATNCFENLDVDEDSEGANYQLYFRDTHYHICVRKLILDIMVAMIASYQSDDSFSIAPLLSAVWSSRKNIVKIRDSYFCIYLKLYYYGLTDGFSVNELQKRIKTNICNWKTALFKCPFLCEGTTNCQLSLEEIQSQVNKMLEDNIIEPFETNKYRLTR